MTIAEINLLEPQQFLDYFAGVFEHSPHYATRAALQRPFANSADLLLAFKKVILEDCQTSQLELIGAHPDLAGKAAMAGELTTESASEQKGVGLDRLSPEEFADFTSVNLAYRAKFAMPYIVCVREHSKESILAGAAQRLEHDLETEIQIALEEIIKIAHYRIKDLLSTSNLIYTVLLV